MCHPTLVGPVSGGAGLRETEAHIPRAGITMPAYLVEPEEEPASAVVILHDVYGASDFYRDVARRLAGEGFAVLLPDLFVREGPLAERTMELARARAERFQQPRALEDIGAAAGWLAERLGPRPIGTMGFCMGGTLALLTAARDLGYSAAVAYYGFPAGRAGWPDRPLDEADKVRIPVLGLWGDQDTGVGMDNVDRYDTLLTEAEADHAFVIYPGLPHGFLTFDPASPHYEAAQDSWAATVAFLQDHLNP